LDEIDDTESLGCVGDSLALEDLHATEPIITQLLARAREWVEKCNEKAEASAKTWRRFALRDSGRVHRAFHTNGLQCKYTCVSAGGGRTEADSDRAINEVLPYVDETLLKALRSEGFDELAAELKTRAAKMRENNGQKNDC
jgi:hypothetical protein